MGKILIVDDSKTILLRVATTIREKLGFEVIEATCLETTIQRLNNHKDFDLALVDLGLPDAPNGEIVDYMTKFNIPTIILTGNESIDKNDFSNRENVIDYIIKDRSYAIEQAVSMTKRYVLNKNHTVLIVDDSKTSLTKIKDLCEKYNLKTLTANNGADALKIIDENSVKLVFTDYNMPIMDGLELTSEIRKKFLADEIGIIAITGEDDKSLLPKFLKYGANDFLHKDSSVEEFIARLVVNIEMQELFENIRDKANKDYMTGMFNRRYLFDEGEKIYNKAKENNSNLFIGVLDIDKFKSINDTYGHDIGDIAIKEIAKIVPKFTPKDAIISRMGGEEFCVVIPNITLEEAKKIFEMIRLAIMQNTIELENLNLKYTISIGFTSTLGKSFDSMIKLADEGLYTAKETGRNKVIYNS